MSLLKKTVLSLIGLIVLTIVAIGLLLATVDPNDHRDKITTLVNEQTGRDLTLGEMQLSIFPHLGLSVENVRLSNAEGFSTAPFAEVRNMTLGVAILPLLKKQLEVDRLVLSGLNLNLERNADGAANWQDLMTASGPDEKASPELEAEQASKNIFSKLDQLNFGGLDIQDSHIHWQDRLNQQEVQLSPFNLISDAVTLDEFFKVELDAQLQLSEPELSNQASLRVHVKLHRNGQIELKDLNQRNHLTSRALPVKSLITQLSLPSLQWALEQTAFDLPQLSLDYDMQGQDGFAAKQLQGKLNINGLSTDLDKQLLSLQGLEMTYQMRGSDDFVLDNAQGNLSLEQPRFDLQTQTLQSGPLNLSGELKGDTLPNGQAQIRLQTQPALNLNTQTASLNNIVLQALGVNASGQVSASQFKTDPKVAATLALEPFNLRQLLTQLGLTLPAVEKMRDPTALTLASASLEADFNAQNQALNIPRILVNLDDSKLQGQASIRNFAKPDIGFNLQLSQIDLNRYLPPKEAAPPADKPTSPSEEATIELPTELLRNLTLNGTLKAGSVVYDNLHPKNILATIKGNNGLFNLAPLQTDIFNTQVKATAALDVRGDQPKYAFSTDTKNLPVGEVLKAFTDNDRLSGSGSVNAKITTAGVRVSEFKQNLNGRAAVDLKDGAVKGFNLAQSIRQAKAKIAGEKAAGPTEELKTDFSSLVSEVTINNGVVDTQKLLAQAPFMRISGNGQVNLVKEEMDYQVKTKIVASDKGQGGEDLKELNGLTIPVKLKGPLTGPNVSLDLASLLEEKAKQEVQQKLEEKKEDVKKQLEEELKTNILKGLKF